MRLDGVYKKTGFFWLPGDEKNKIPGVLSISDGGGIELEIVGHFDEEMQLCNADPNIGRIIGNVEKDGLITLDECLYRKKNFAFGGVSKSIILVAKALVGAKWGKDQIVTFNTFSFSVDCLDEWIGISGITVNNDWDNRTAAINYKPPEGEKILLDNGMVLEIRFSYMLPGRSMIKEAKITQRVYFTLVSDGLLVLNDFISVAHKIVNLMCFAMDDIVSIKKVSATSYEIQKSVSCTDKYPVPIAVYYKSIPYTEKCPDKTRHEMIFSFSTIKNNVQKVFNGWLEAYGYLYPALSLYFSTKMGAQKYLDGKFLALVQGLETYHRRTNNETIMGSKEFENLVSAIIEKCPEDHVEWLMGRLAHGNEVNLGKRIKSIIEPFKDIIGNSNYRGKLIRSIVDTRNYLTHYSNELKEVSAKNRDLWILCLKMEAIFNLHFLKVIGFSDTEIRKVAKNHFPLKQKLEEV